MTQPAPTPAPASPLEAALAYAKAGLRVAPITPGEKYPKSMGAWQDAATTDPDTIRSWWTGLYRGHGVCIAFDQLPDGRWVFAVDIDGASHGADGHALWDNLVDGYTEPPDTVEAITGGGGRHLLFTAPTEIRNGFLRGIDKAAVQLRGHGGQCVVEPTIHPDTGTPYTWVDGHAPWERRIAEAPDWLLPLLEPDEPPPRPPRSQAKDLGDRPGDHFAANVDWADILTADGWELHHVDRTGERYWTRPGKDRRSGASATTDYKGTDSLKVFTSSMTHAGLDAEQTYTKLGYVAATRFGGDHSAAASALKADGHHGDPVDQIRGMIADRPLPKPRATPPPPPPDPAAPWPEPTPLPQRIAPVEWPAGVLPPWLENQARAAANNINTNVDVTAMLGLGALSIATFGHVKVRLVDGYTQDTNLYLVVALPPTEGKSPAHEKMIDPLRAWEYDRMARRAKARAEAQAELDVLTQQAKDASNSAARTGSVGDLVDSQTVNARIAAFEMPPTGQVFVGDTTPERLAELLGETGERIAVVSDEGGVLDVDRYAGKDRAPNLDLWLQAWSGRPHQPERRNGLRAHLAHPLICLVATAQPHDWDRIMGDPALRNRGFPQRIMASVPTARAGTRNKDPRLRAHDSTAEAIYAGRITELASDCDTWEHPAVLTFTDEAVDVWVEWANVLERRIGLDLASEAGWIGKMCDQATLRLAGLLHIAWDHPTSAPIDARTMRRAIAVGDYWLAHRLAATVDLDLITDAKKLLGWVLRREDDRFDRAELGRRGPRGLRSVSETAEALALLAQHGWVRPVGIALGAVDGAEALARGADHWLIRPAETCAEGAREMPKNPTEGEDTSEATTDSPPSSPVSRASPYTRETTGWMDVEETPPTPARNARTDPIPPLDPTIIEALGDSPLLGPDTPPATR